MFKSMAYLVTTVAVVVGGYSVLGSVSPEAAARIGGLVYDQILGWDEAACEANALGCLTSRYSALQKLEKQVDHSVRTMRAQADRITALVDEQQLMVAKNASFLDVGKGLYKANSTQPDAPIEFAGKTYPNGNSFKQQLALLFQEKVGLEANLKDAVALKKKLQDRLENLMVQSGHITLAKRMIPAQIELVRANIVLSDFGQNVDVINNVIKGSEAGLAEADQVLRTTKDLMQQDSVQTDNNSVQSKAFEEFISK
ncbi:hypothetical protein D9M68_250430 [compost metagenome]